MGSFPVVVHFPKAEFVSAVLFTDEPGAVEQRLFVRSVAPFNDPVAPRFAFFDEGMCNVHECCPLTEGGLPFRTVGKLHGESHVVVRENNIERRQSLYGPLQEISKCTCAVVMVDFTILDPCAHVYDADFEGKTAVAFDCGQLLPVHLGTVRTNVQRLRLFFSFGTLPLRPSSRRMR